MSKKQPSVWSGASVARARSMAMALAGVTRASHIIPRAYCIAKPSPVCAVFATPWMDAEPQIRIPEYSSYTVVTENAVDVIVGDWCSLAYVVNQNGCQYRTVVEILR